MKRGDLVVVALPGDYGKPRPALVIQSNFFDQHPSITVLPLTTDLREAPLVRVSVDPDEANCLKARSQIMIDKATTVARHKIGKSIGILGENDILAVDRAFSLFVGLN